MWIHVNICRQAGSTSSFIIPRSAFCLFFSLFYIFWHDLCWGFFFVSEQCTKIFVTDNTEWLFSMLRWESSMRREKGWGKEQARSSSIIHSCRTLSLYIYTWSYIMHHESNHAGFWLAYFSLSEDLNPFLSCNLAGAPRWNNNRANCVMTGLHFEPSAVAWVSKLPKVKKKNCVDLVVFELWTWLCYC